MKLMLQRGEGPDSQPNDGAPTDGEGSIAASHEPMPFESGAPDPDELLPRVVGWYKLSRDHFQAQRQEMAEMFDLVAGHQWSDEDLQILSDQMRPAITFNRIGPFVESVGGLEINNRQDITFLPRQVGMSGGTDLMSSAAQWARQECDAEDEETEAFLDLVTCGWGWTQTRMSYDDDPDGQIITERIPPLEMYPDPSARKQNLSDRRFHIRMKDMPLAAAEELFPKIDPAMLHAQWAEDMADATRQPHNARLAPYYRIDQAAGTDRQQFQVRMAEVEWWEWEPAWRVLDPSSGRFVLLDAKRYALARMEARLTGSPLTSIKDKRRRYWKAIVGAEVLTIVEGPSKGGFQYKCMTGKRDENRGTWYGIVRAMKDPQLWANKWVSQGLHIFNTNAKGGLIVEEDAVADMDELRDSWAGADAVTVINPGAMNKIQQKQPPAFPQQLNAMTEMAISSIPQVSGIPTELMGQSRTDAPQVALLEAGRRQQAMNILARLFNAKRRYHKEQGRLLLWMIQEFIADGRMIMIGGQEQRQYVPLLHDPGFAEYDCIVEDGPTSPNMKEKVWGALMGLFPMLRGLPIPPAFYISAMKYSPVPASFVQEAQGILQQPPPIPPQVQAQEQLNQARANLLNQQAGKIEAEGVRTRVEAALMPHDTTTVVTERQARIESLRAQAAAALAKVGLSADDQKFQQTMGAVDALLRAHGAALNHAAAVQGANAPPEGQQPGAGGDTGAPLGAQSPGEPTPPQLTPPTPMAPMMPPAAAPTSF